MKTFDYEWLKFQITSNKYLRGFCVSQVSEGFLPKIILYYIDTDDIETVKRMLDGYAQGYEQALHDIRNQLEKVEPIETQWNRRR